MDKIRENVIEGEKKTRLVVMSAAENIPEFHRTFNYDLRRVKLVPLV